MKISEEDEPGTWPGEGGEKMELPGYESES